MATRISPSRNTLNRNLRTIHRQVIHDACESLNASTVRLFEGNGRPQCCFNGKTLTSSNMFRDESLELVFYVSSNFRRNVDVAAAVQLGRYIVSVERINVKILQRERGGLAAAGWPGNNNHQGRRHRDFGCISGGSCFLIRRPCSSMMLAFF